MSEKRFQVDPDTINQSTLLEVQAEISREMNTPLEESAGIVSAWQRVRNREGLIREALKHMIGGKLLELTAKTSTASVNHSLPTMRKLRTLLREPHAPEQVDMAYLHATRLSLARAAYQGYRQDGRGSLLLDLTQQQEHTIEPAWLSMGAIKQNGAAWVKPIRKHVSDYDPMKEFVVTILRPHDDVRVYRVALSGQ